MHRLVLAPLMAVGLLLLTVGTAAATTGHHHHDGESRHSIEITAHDFAYRLSTDRVDAGLVKTSLYNDGDQPHQAQIAQFKSGKGVADFKALVKAGKLDAVIGLFAGFYGGPNAVLPGRSQTTFQNLPPGHYLVLCFVTDPKTGMPHFAMGMYAPFDAVGAPRNGWLDTRQTVAAVDPFRLRIPAALTTHAIVRFENRSTMDVHEFSIGKLHPGKTPADLVAWAKHPTGPPPYDERGGAGALNPGGREWFTLDLRPGHYVAFCLVPDEKTGLPHAALGMVKAFTVVRGD
ncbi:MAG: hypothetical protein ACXVX8_05815 [Blastococcus sp.]